MNTVLFVVLVVVIGLAAIFFIPQLLIRRALGQVIRNFRRQNATNPHAAKTQEELKLAPKSYLMRMMSTRDYKPQAMDLLINAKIIMTTEDGKYYLSEQSLAESPIGRKFRQPRH